MSSPKHMKVKIYSLGQLLESYFNDFLTRTMISTIIAISRKKHCCCLPYLIVRKRNTASLPKITQGLIFFFICDQVRL